MAYDVINASPNFTEKLLHCLLTICKDMEQYTIDTAIDQWRRRLTARVSATFGTQLVIKDIK